MGSFKNPSTPLTTNKTIRFPNDVVEAVEKAIQGKNVLFPHLSLPQFVQRWKTSIREMTSAMLLY